MSADSEGCLHTRTGSIKSTQEVKIPKCFLSLQTVECTQETQRIASRMIGELLVSGIMPGPSRASALLCCWRVPQPNAFCPLPSTLGWHGNAAAASRVWRHQNKKLICPDISCRAPSPALMCALVSYRRNIYQTAATPNLQNLVMLCFLSLPHCMLRTARSGEEWSHQQVYKHAVREVPG